MHRVSVIHASPYDIYEMLREVGNPDFHFQWTMPNGVPWKYEGSPVYECQYGVALFYEGVIVAQSKDYKDKRV